MTSGTSSLRYRRILLKLSGEALMGEQGFGIDPQVVQRISAEVAALAAAGVEIGLVVGGGNIFRGVSLSASGMDRANADQMGMLATVINALSLQDALQQAGARTRVMSALPIHQVCEDYVRRRALRHLEKGDVVIFAAGTGNPFFTTDTAAALRAVEIKADLLLKATKVDGIYSADPMKDRTATRYQRLDYDEALSRQLGVMDLTAMVLCRDHNMPLRVFDMNQPGALQRILEGADVGTLVQRGESA